MLLFALYIRVTMLDSAHIDARWMPMPENNEPCPDESLETSDERSIWIAERVSTLLQEKGIAPRQQAAFLAELCALSFSQARRKLRGAMWTFAEILTIAEHFKVSIDLWFLAEDASHPAIDSSGDGLRSLPLQDAQMLFASHRIGCQVRLGRQCIAAPEADALITGQFAGEWLVGTPDTLPLPDAEGPLFCADRVEIQPAVTRQRIRIAILDDDGGVSGTLCDWFNAAGYEAHAFTTSEQLVASGLVTFAAYIVDFMLSAGDSSQATIKAIRQARPDAPIVLLTGKLRSGLASEADLTTLLRTANVLFFEKPVRPSVIAATIETQLDKLASRNDR